jgi:transcriptional regulator with XRE-family HTH domain
VAQKAASAPQPIVFRPAIDDELDALRSVLGITQVQLAQILGTTPRTVSRWRSTSAAHVEPRPSAAVRLRDMDHLRWLMETNLGAEQSREWLRRPNWALRGRAPIDLLLDRDIDTVLGLVLTIAEGGVG